MLFSSRTGLGLGLLIAGLALSTFAQSPQKTIMMNHATGTFDVKLSPLSIESDASFGRMSIDKQFHGGIDGVSKGEMMTAGTGIKTSAGYVAVERVTGTLAGKNGSFSLLHTGIMNRGVPQLSIVVVPDSGTGQLEGITGKLAITIADGKHSYDFEYALPDSH